MKPLVKEYYNLKRVFEVFNNHNKIYKQEKILQDKIYIFLKLNRVVN